jgi:hypothetical protein
MFVMFGGNLNNGSNDGPFYLNLNNSVSNANWNYGAFGVFISKLLYFLPLGKNNVVSGYLVAMSKQY